MYLCFADYLIGITGISTNVLLLIFLFLNPIHFDIILEKYFFKISIAIFTKIKEY